MTKDDFTVFVGNLSEKVTEAVLYELFLQAGPLTDVRLPSNNGVRKSFGFVEYKHEISVPYALRLLDSTKLFGRPIKLNSRSRYLHLYQPPAQRHGVRERLGAKVSDDSALRMVGGGLGRKFSDKSMLPSGSSRKNNKRGDDLQSDKSWGKSWTPKEYPSQHEESKGQNRNNLNGSKNQNRLDQGTNRKSYHKTPYYNEKHHNRDKNKHDSHSSQRPRVHRPFTR